MKNNVVAVVVTYNRKEKLEICINKLLEQTYPCDILIIDNSSTDGTEELIKTKYNDKTEVKYINTGINLGGAGGFSFGIKKAVEKEYKFVWIMDDDCYPTKNALDMFIKINNELNENYGWLSSKCLYKDNELCLMNIQRSTLREKITDFKDELIQAQLASFVSLFFKAETIKNYGLPIKEFFIWGDDWEFTRRISRKEKCYVVSNSIVYHAIHSNIKADISNDSKERIERFFYLARNEYQLYKTEGIKWKIFYIIKQFRNIFKALFFAKDSRLKRVSVILKGFIKAYSFQPEIEFIIDEKNEKR